jgi:hypothetical protein
MSTKEQYQQANWHMRRQERAQARIRYPKVWYAVEQVQKWRQMNLSFRDKKEGI